MMMTTSKTHTQEIEKGKEKENLEGGAQLDDDERATPFSLSSLRLVLLSSCINAEFIQSKKIKGVSSSPSFHIYRRLGLGLPRRFGFVFLLLPTAVLILFLLFGLRRRRGRR